MGAAEFFHWQTFHYLKHTHAHIGYDRTVVSRSPLPWHSRFEVLSARERLDWFCRHVAACSRNLVLKQCLRLPTPLWQEIMGLMGGEYAEMAQESRKQSPWEGRTAFKADKPKALSIQLDRKKMNTILLKVHVLHCKLKLACSYQHILTNAQEEWACLRDYVLWPQLWHKHCAQFEPVWHVIFVIQMTGLGAWPYSISGSLHYRSKAFFSSFIMLLICL